MTEKTYILLDIDGVILPFSEGYDPPPKNQDEEFLKSVKFNAECVSRINHLAEKSDALIMLLSNWRKIFSAHRALLKEALIRSGLDEKRFADPWTCPYRFSSEKGHEAYMTARDVGKSSTDVVTILVVDDSCILFNRRDYRSPKTYENTRLPEIYENTRLFEINPDPEVGFSEKDLSVALGFLGK